MKDEETVSESDRTLPERTDAIKWTPAAVKAFRLSRGQSQEDFAPDVGVSRPTVSGWENGVTEVSPLSARRLDALESGFAPERGAREPYWRGAAWAALMMNETVGKILREIALADAQDPDIPKIIQHAAAHAPPAPSSTESSHPKTGAAGRRTASRPHKGGSGGT